jgi:neutral amino acid transport system permease protein
VQELLQTTINGLASGSIFALGAVGLSLVYGILKLVNFAHGDFMTLGGYAAFVVNVTLGMPLVVAALGAIAVTAAIGLMLEWAIWRPMRNRGAGVMQLLLMTIGLAFVLRNLVLLFWGGEVRTLDVDQTQAWNPFDLTISLNQVIVISAAGSVLVAVGLLLRLTRLGKSMRALSDNRDLAEVAGIDTRRVITYTWILAGSLAGLAGMFAAINTTLTPNTGWFLLLGIFAAVVLGGIGNAYGALAGGLVIGLVQEWSTMIFAPTYKEAVAFAVLILILLVRPQGIFGHRERTA